MQTPARKPVSPRDALMTWREWSVRLKRPPQVLCPLLGGRTNRSWLLDTDCGRAVLRLDHEHPPWLGIDRGREALVMRSLAGKPYLPPLWYQNPVSGIQVTGFISGEIHDVRSLPASLSAALLSIVDDYQKVTLPPIAPLDYYHYLSRYWQRCANQGRIREGWHAEWRKFLPQLRAFQDAPWTPVLSHHDLDGRNIISSDRGLVLLDWEYAHLGHPGFDRLWLAGAEPHGDARILQEISHWLDRLWQQLRSSADN